MIVMLKANPPAGAPGISITPGAPPPAVPAGPIPIQLALRLKVYNRQITEAEHLIARITAIEAMGFTLPLYSKNGWSQFTR